MEFTLADIDWVWLNTIIAFFLPLVISFVKNQEWPTMTKRILALLVSAIVGVAAVGLENGWAFDTVTELAGAILASVTQIWVIAQVAYLSFWKDSAPEQAAANALYSGSD